MKVTGKLVGAQVDLSGQLTATFSINEKEEGIHALNEMGKEDLMQIEVKPYKKKRSLDANGMLWACIGDIAKALRADKWDVYLQMLKRYGSFTYITVKPNAVKRMKEIWRECEEVGEMPNGDMQMLCYYGSSTYDTAEFSVLLDGVISEMKEMGLHIPASKEVERSLEAWTKKRS